MISYAGYINPDGSITGDPINVEITEVYERNLNLFIVGSIIDRFVFLIKMQVCLKLGWKSPKGEFDILPLVLSTNGHEYELFLMKLKPHVQFKFYVKINFSFQS